MTLPLPHVTEQYPYSPQLLHSQFSGQQATPQGLVSTFGPVQSWPFDPNGRFVLDLKTSENEHLVGHCDH